MSLLGPALCQERWALCFLDPASAQKSVAVFRSWGRSSSLGQPMEPLELSWGDV